MDFSNLNMNISVNRLYALLEVMRFHFITAYSYLNTIIHGRVLTFMTSFVFAYIKKGFIL